MATISVTSAAETTILVIANQKRTIGIIWNKSYKAMLTDNISRRADIVETKRCMGAPEGRQCWDFAMCMPIALLRCNMLVPDAAYSERIEFIQD